MPNDLPAPIQVLFAGDIADDDRLWVVRCSLAELRLLFLNPVVWVTALGSLPDWRPLGGGTLPAPVLTPDFAVVAQRTDAVDPDGAVLVQGIAGTNALTVVADRQVAILAASVTGAVADAANPFGPFWAAVASDPRNLPSGKKRFPLVVLEDRGRWYGHFEIRDAASTPDALANRVAGFLLASLYDPTGYATMLSGLDQTAVHLRGNAPVPGGPIAIAGPATPPTTSLYANVVGGSTQPRPSDDPSPDPFICANLSGGYSSGGGTNDGGMAKRYVNDDPPPAILP